MGKHCKLKKKRFKEIQSKSKTDYKRTPRTIPWTKSQEKFFTKNCKYFRYRGCQCHLKREALPPYSMVLQSTKAIKLTLYFNLPLLYYPKAAILIHPQELLLMLYFMNWLLFPKPTKDLTCSLVYHSFSMYYYIRPSQLPWCISKSFFLWSISSTACCFPSSPKA